MLYTPKINPIFSDIQNRIFDFEVAALDMMNFEWSYTFPRSRINLPFVVSFILLGDIGETKLIREATLKSHISGSLRGISILRYGLELPGEAGSDPRGHLGVTWGVYLCAGKPPWADIILSHPPDLTQCDSVIGLAIPAMSGHIQYRGAAS